MEILPERIEDLAKLANNAAITEQIRGLAYSELSSVIMALGRETLNIDPHTDINDLKPATQSELLIVMRTLRNTINPPSDAGLPWQH